MKLHFSSALEMVGLETYVRKENDDEAGTVWHLQIPGEPVDLAIEYKPPLRSCGGRLLFQRGDSKLLVCDTETDLDFP